jgi:glycine dehydrogenase subunit 1
MFIPHTDDERQEMLKTIGKKDLAELFNVIPEDFRFPELDLPPALSEMEAQQQFSNIASANNACDEMACFLGAGAYNHYVPAAVSSRPTPPTNRKYHKVRFRRSSNSNP